VTRADSIRIVGSILVRNEDVFVERAIRNAARFCDRLYALDHLSTDATWDILRALARDLDHLEVSRSGYAGESHQQLEQYAGTSTWVLRIDGDHLYDPVGLDALRDSLRAGAYHDVFRVRAHVLHCDALDAEAGRASGYPGPPSRTGVHLYNFAAITAWSGCPEHLQGGTLRFRPGYSHESVHDLTESTEWETDPLRFLHVCFLQRSSHDGSDFAVGRRNLSEDGVYRRGLAGTLRRLVRSHRIDPRIEELHRRGTNWKQDRYRRGGRVSVDAAPFLGPVAIT
jgi:hypothetical protein